MLTAIVIAAKVLAGRISYSVKKQDYTIAIHEENPGKYAFILRLFQVREQLIFILSNDAEPKLWLMNHFYLSPLFSLYAQVARANDLRGKKNDNDFIPLRGVGIVFANLKTRNFFTEATFPEVFSDYVVDGGDYNTGHL